MIYGYIRVSSDRQTVENQRFEINKFCERNKLVIDGWIEETISGTKAYNKRELGKLLRRVQKTISSFVQNFPGLAATYSWLWKFWTFAWPRSAAFGQSKITIALVTTSKAKCLPLLLVCLPRLSATLSVSEPRKLWRVKSRGRYTWQTKRAKECSREIQVTRKRNTYSRTA